MSEKMSEAQVAECRKAFEDDVAKKKWRVSLAWDTDYDEYVYDEANRMFDGYLLAWNRRPERWDVVTAFGHSASTIDGKPLEQLPAPVGAVTSVEEIDYFVGNANGRGLIRIECQGYHIASLPRGKESEEWARKLVDAYNSHLIAITKQAPTEDLVPWREIDRLCTELKYIAGIVERGRGVTLAPDVSVSAAVLGYVKDLEAATKQAPDVGAVREALRLANIEASGELCSFSGTVQDRWNGLKKLHDAVEKALAALESTPTANPQQNDPDDWPEPGMGEQP